MQFKQKLTESLIRELVMEELAELKEKNNALEEEMLEEISGKSAGALLGTVIAALLATAKPAQALSFEEAVNVAAQQGKPITAETINQILKDAQVNDAIKAGAEKLKAAKQAELEKGKQSGTDRKEFSFPASSVRQRYLQKLEKDKQQGGVKPNS